MTGEARSVLGGLLLALAAVVASAAPTAAIEEADRLFLVGERAFQDGLSVLARRTLERFIERFPADARIPDATLLVGKARLAQGAFPQALEAFRKAQTFTPVPGKPLEARFWEGEALFRMRRFAEARTVYDKLLAEDAASPMAPDALYGLGWSQLELKQRDAAAATFRQLIETFPQHQAVPAATVLLGRLQVELKRYADAERILRGFVQRYPDHKQVPEARYLLGVARISSGHVDEGITDLRAVVAAYPSHDVAAQARRVVIDTLLRDGKKADLAQEYKSLIAQSPHTAEGLYDAGVIATRLGRPKDADQAWLELRTEFPEHALAGRAALELGHAAFARSNWKEGATLGRAAAKSPEEPTRAAGFLLVGESELRLKRFGAAHEAFQAAVAGAGQDAGVRYRALAGSGLAMEEQRQWAQAVKYYDEVASDCPDKELKQWAKTRRAAVAANLKSPPKSAPRGAAPRDAPAKGGAKGSKP